jgi:hypothetical protein
MKYTRDALTRAVHGVTSGIDTGDVYFDPIAFYDVARHIEDNVVVNLTDSTRWIEDKEALAIYHVTLAAATFLTSKGAVSLGHDCGVACLDYATHEIDIVREIKFSPPRDTQKYLQQLGLRICRRFYGGLGIDSAEDIIKDVEALAERLK